MALGRPYTLSARPNYGLCTDAGDAVQLTDGEFMASFDGFRFNRPKAPVHALLAYWARRAGAAKR